MRLRIVHESTLVYDPAVSHAIFALRQTPNTDNAQFVRSWRIDVSLDCWLDRVADSFGNTVCTFSLKGPIDEVKITAVGDIDVDNTHGVFKERSNRLPPEFFLRGSDLTEPTPDLREIAAQIFAENATGLGRAHALNYWLATSLDLSPGCDEALTAAETLAAKKGNAASSTHLFATIARCMDIPTRIVSGYLYEPDKPEATGLHIWAECYMPNLGWVGFDPLFERCPTDQYVRLAVGTDSLGAQSLRDGFDGYGARALTTKVTIVSQESLNSSYQSQSQS